MVRSSFFSKVLQVDYLFVSTGAFFQKLNFLFTKNENSCSAAMSFLQRTKKVHQTWWINLKLEIPEAKIAGGQFHNLICNIQTAWPQHHICRNLYIYIYIYCVTFKLYWKPIICFTFPNQLHQFSEALVLLSLWCMLSDACWNVKQQMQFLGIKVLYMVYLKEMDLVKHASN